MAGTEDDIAAMERVLDDQPDDWETRLVLADRYDERDGGASPMAAAQRWMARHRKHPRPFGLTWDWWSYRPGGVWTADKQAEPYALAEDLFARLTKPMCSSGWSSECAYREYPDRRAAEADLARAAPE